MFFFNFGFREVYLILMIIIQVTKGFQELVSVCCRSTQHTTWQNRRISNNSMSNSFFNPSNLVSNLQPENVEPPRVRQRVSQPPAPATI